MQLHRETHSYNHVLCTTLINVGWIYRHVGTSTHMSANLAIMYICIAVSQVMYMYMYSSHNWLEGDMLKWYCNRYHPSALVFLSQAYIMYIKLQKYRPHWTHYVAPSIHFKATPQFLNDTHSHWMLLYLTDEEYVEFLHSWPSSSTVRYNDWRVALQILFTNLILTHIVLAFYFLDDLTQLKTKNNKLNSEIWVIIEWVSEWIKFYCPHIDTIQVIMPVGSSVETI